jgi:regulator of replication initiation timing
MTAKADKLQNQLTQTQADVSTYKEMVKDTFKEKELLQKEIEKINTAKNNQSANNTVDGNNG